MLTTPADGSGPGSMPLDVAVDVTSEKVVLRLSGDLDASTAPELWSRIDDLPCDRTTAVDLRDLRFLDSSGIGCLLKLHRRVADGGGGVLEAHGVEGHLRRTLEMAQLNRVIAILD